MVRPWTPTHFTGHVSFSAPPGWTTPCLGRVALAQGGLLGGCALIRWIYAFMQYCVHAYIYIYIHVETLYLYIYIWYVSVTFCHFRFIYTDASMILHSKECGVVTTSDTNNLHTFAETHLTEFCTCKFVVGKMELRWSPWWSPYRGLMWFRFDSYCFSQSNPGILYLFEVDNSSHESQVS